MAAPVVATIGTSASGNGSSIATNAPSGVTSGDYLVLEVTTEDSTTITTPTGWTLVDSVQPGAALSLSVFVRVAAGTADDTPTVTLGATKDYHAKILRVTGQHASTPLGVSQTTGGSDNATTMTFTGVTVGENDSLVLIFASNAAGTISISSWPTGFTTVYAVDAGNNNEFCGEDVLAAGSTGSLDVVFSGVNKRAGVLLAISPAAGGGGAKPTYYHHQQQVVA